jgi:hypothetical protein
MSIEIKIIKRFENMGLFQDLCEDYQGKISPDGETITFPNHITFNKVINLIVHVFLPRNKIRRFLDFIEIKEKHNETDYTQHNTGYL